MRLLTVANLIWLIVYALFVGTSVWGLRSAREWAEEKLSTPEAREDLKAWNDEVKKQSQGKGPVMRREITRSEPTTLVLLRDYYATCQFTVLLLGSALFFSFMFLARGAFSGNTRPLVEDSDL